MNVRYARLRDLHRSRRAWVRRVLAFASLWVAMAFGCTPSFAASSHTPAITMTSSVGFAGYYSQNHWIPAYIEMHNNGPATSGELVLSVSGSIGNGRIQDGRLTWPIRIPSGWHEYSIAIPGNVFGAPSAPELDCIVEGQYVPPTYLTANKMENNDLIAVLTTEANDAQFLTGTTGPAPASNPVLPIALNPAELPDQPNLLDTLTAVVASPDTLLGLSEAQRSALWTWVRMGGMLFVTGVHWGPTREPLPIVAGPQRRVMGTKLVEFIGGSATNLKPVEMDGQAVRDGAQVVVGTATSPLIASMSIGRGSVIQTSFDPIQSALVRWPGNVSLWTTLLKKMDHSNFGVDQNLLDPSGILSLSQASDALSPLRVPSLSFWGVVFGVYVLLIGPVTFLILRRFRRQSLAWGILPVVSILTTVSIYTFGESQRPAGALTEGVAVLDLIGNSQAESYGISAFMAPSTVATSAETSQPTLLLPLAEQGFRHIGSATVSQSDSHSVIAFDNVGRWGVRYIYSAGSLSGQGQIDASLDTTYYFTGTLTNRTKYTLHDVAIFWNDKMYPVGDMPPGKTVPVKGPESTPELTDTWLGAYGNYNRDIARGIGHTLGSYSEPLVNLNLDQNHALIVATTSQRVPTLPMLNMQPFASSDTLTLVRQFVPVANYPLG